MNVETEAIDLVSSSIATIESLPSAISATEPRYSFFKYVHEHDGETQSPVIFISSCPDGLKVKERMLHAASRRLFAKSAPEEAGVEVNKRVCADALFYCLRQR
jgi:twinfilin-like protein